MVIYMKSFKQRSESIYTFNSMYNAGFTLVELMVVVVIISLLAMVAVPSYNTSVSKARRADAQSSLSNFANVMERFFTENGTYLGAEPLRGQVRSLHNQAV